MAANTRKLLEALKIPKVMVVGHSMGGMAAARFAPVLYRYVGHRPAAWNEQFEAYTRLRYATTLGSEWPRFAMAQSLITQMLYVDQVVDDWARI